MLGWGTVLPYQYAYAANTRGWGSLAAAGRVQPLLRRGAGRRPDRRAAGRPHLARSPSPSAPRLIAALGAGQPGRRRFAARPSSRGMFVFGVGITAAAPGPDGAGAALGRRAARTAAASSPGSSPGRRSAWPSAPSPPATWSTSTALDGMWPAFATAAAGFVLSALLILPAGQGRPGASPPRSRRTRPQRVPGSARCGHGPAPDLGQPGPALDRARHGHAGARLLRPVRERAAGLRADRPRRRRDRDRPRGRRQLRRHHRAADGRRAGDRPPGARRRC